MPGIRYRFGAFSLSTGRRALTRDGREVPLIPRYFDLLVLLLERRGEAVHRRVIFDRVWSDVVVSDGALTQAIRTLRRTLGDDVRTPIYIRTVSRHGYRFVHADVIEEEEQGRALSLPEPPVGTGAPPDRDGIEREGGIDPDPWEEPLRRLLTAGPAVTDPQEPTDDAREAAEDLHALGTAGALRRLEARPGRARALALLRDTRWDVPGSGAVPLLGRSDGLHAFAILAGIRLRRAARLAWARWAAAAGGGALAGFIAGLAGGALLMLAPGSAAPPSVPVALALVGAAVGGLGAAGVGAGLATAEALARSLRGTALVAGGAIGGGLVGAVAHALGAWTLQDLFGHDLSAVGGGLEGLVIGGAAGLGYALSTPRPGGGGMASPRGAARLAAAAVTGLCCAAAGLALSRFGGQMAGASIDLIARSVPGSHVGLEPIARLLGEPHPGPFTRSALSIVEGLLFGVGLILGLTRRPY